MLNHTQLISKKILVTVGAGFIGSNPVDSLVIIEGTSIIVLDNLETGNLKNIEHHINQGKIKFIKGDIKNLNNVSLPKIEERTGHPLSPYAVSKKTNELYAKVYAELYTMQITGLRYFNVFGPKQNPEGPYAAVIPIFINRLLKNEACIIYGDGSNKRIN
jgi:nucleoside-diphosphate-sugar epimerase